MPRPGRPVNIRALKDARERMGWTQKELTEKANKKGLKATPAWIGNIETGRARASLKKLSVVADVLGVKLDDIMAPPGPGENGAVDWLVQQVVKLKEELAALKRGNNL